MTFKQPPATTTSSGLITLAGDLGGTEQSPSVLKINGTSVPSSPSANQVLVATSSSATTWAQIVDAYVSATAAIAGTKINPNFGSQAVSTTGTLSVGGATVTSLQDTGLSTGVVHSDSSGNFTSSLIVNADVSATAAIAGSKISPNFGTQALTAGTFSLGTNTSANSLFGSITYTTKTFSGTGTIDTSTNDLIIYADTSGGGFTLTLPAPTTGRFLIIKDKKQTFIANNLTIAPHAGEKIDGSNSNLVLNTNNTEVVFTSDGTDWYTNLFAESPTGGAGGDLSGNYPNPTVAKINGASVPAAGSLTTGNVLQVSGSSSLTYAPVNLAGGSNFVTGVLPTGNQAAQTLGGDLSGTTASATVISISGASPIAITPAVLQWTSGTSSPTLTQADNAVASATATNMKVQAQSATGTGSTGGDLILASGTGTSSDGYVSIEVGQTQIITATAAYGLQFNQLSTGVLHSDSGGNVTSSLVVNADVSSSAAISGTKINPNFGSQNVSTTGTLSAGVTTVTSFQDTGLSTGVVHSDSSGNFTSSLIVDADVSATAAIAYSKLNLSNSIVNADVNTAAAIAYSKLNLTNSIVNADINTSAAIAGSKISPNFGVQALTAGTFALGTTTSVNSLSGSITFTTKTFSSTGTIDTSTNDMLVFADTSGGAFTLTLPAPTTGRTLIIKDKKQTFNTNNLTVAPHSTEKIDGVAANLILATNNEEVIFISDGTDWYTDLFAESPTGGAGGDLSGNYPNPTVAKINGTTVTTAGGSLTTGQVLRVTGSSSSDWGALDLSNSNATTGTLSNTKQQAQTVGGDLSGTTASATVAQLQGSIVLSSTPSAGQVLTATSSTAAHWATPSSGTITLTGDVTGSGTSSIATTVAAISGTSPILITPSTLEWTSATSSPSLTQAANTTASGVATNMTIQAQSATGSTSIGGDLILASGTGTSSDGYVSIEVGQTQIITATAAYGLQFNQLSTGVLHSDSSGNITSSLIVNADVSSSAAIAYSKLNLSNSIVNADINTSAAIAYSKLNLTGSIVNADIAAGAAIAVSKLAAGTSAQILLNNSTPTPTWTTVSGDATISNTGVVTVAKINGTTVTTAGGSLTTGQVLRVTGASSSDWGALDLSNSNATTGILSNTKQQAQTMSGDVTGTTAASVVSAISGTTPIVITPSELQFKNTTSAPLIDQASTSTSDGQNFTVAAQSTTHSLSNGGNLYLSSGQSSTGTDGYVALQVGGVDQFQVGPAAVTVINFPFTVSSGLATLNAGVTAANGAVSLTGNAASSLTTSSGALTLTGAANSVWSTSSGNLTVDAASALNLGTSNATSIAVGKSGITTTVTGGLTQLTGAVSITGNAASSLTTTTASGHSLTITAGDTSTWSTAGGSLTVDSAAALNLGSSNATSIAIGKSGITTTVTGGLTQVTGAVSLHANAASDYTTSSGALTLTSNQAATWSTSNGALSLSGNAGVNLQNNTTTIAKIDSNKFYAVKGYSQNVTIKVHGDSPYTVQATDNIIAADVSGGVLTVNLPTSPAVGDTYAVKDYKGAAATSSITVDSGSGNKIDGAQTFVMDVNYQSITVVCVVASPAQWMVM